MKYSQEHWKPIKEYQGHTFTGLYEVSDWGRVRNRETKKEVAQYSDGRGQGYMKIKLFDTDGIRTQIRIHRLVAYHFIRKPKAGQNEVNHRDGNVKNNSWTNLEWCTRAENVADYKSRKVKVAV